MTDANLMDASCIHGGVWWDCEACDELCAQHMRLLDEWYNMLLGYPEGRNW